MKIRKVINKIPLARVIARFIYRYIYSRLGGFPGSSAYWEQRYLKGGDSGAGSHNRLREFKAGVINSFIRENDIESVIEFGCGDGHQLALAVYPEYIGLDVSPTAIKLCQDRFASDTSKSFFSFEPGSLADNKNIRPADLGLSLDVIFHLIEDKVFEEHMKALFSSAKKYVIVYSSNFDEGQSYHVKNREFTRWITQNATGWQLMQKIDNPYPYDTSDIENTSRSDFYIFKKTR
jgi:SAM-dependent methyltransferase